MPFKDDGSFKVKNRPRLNMPKGFMYIMVLCTTQITLTMIQKYLSASPMMYIKPFGIFKRGLFFTLNDPSSLKGIDMPS